MVPSSFPPLFHLFFCPLPAFLLIQRLLVANETRMMKNLPNFSNALPPLPSGSLLDRLILRQKPRQWYFLPSRIKTNLLFARVFSTFFTPADHHPPRRHVEENASGDSHLPELLPFLLNRRLQNTPTHERLWSRSSQASADSTFILPYSLLFRRFAPSPAD